MRNVDKWFPNEEECATRRVLGYGIVGALMGSTMIVALATWLIRQYA